MAKFFKGFEWRVLVGEEVDMKQLLALIIWGLKRNGATGAEGIKPQFFKQAFLGPTVVVEGGGTTKGAKIVKHWGMAGFC